MRDNKLDEVLEQITVKDIIGTDNTNLMIDYG